jgi:hypothetical protein
LKISKAAFEYLQSLKKPTPSKHFLNFFFADAAIYVAPGFNVSSLNVTTNFGAGQMYLQDLAAQSLSIVHHG